VADQGNPGWVDAQQAGSVAATLKFLIEQGMAQAMHATPVKVITVHAQAGNPPPPPTVDVQPCVAQVDQTGNATAHGTVFGVPVWRYQAGAVVVINDPIPGDLGLLVVSDRDISSVIANQGPANPGSFRRNSFSDGVYFGAIGNVTPSTYVWLQQSGNITIEAPGNLSANVTNNATVTAGGSVTVTAGTTVTINGPSGITMNGNVTVNGAITATGNVKAGSIDLETHVHTGVTTGGSNTGGPTG
jgi:hypothetical protein